MDKWIQRRFFFLNLPTWKTNYQWRPCLLRDRNDMRILYRGRSIDMIDTKLRFIWSNKIKITLIIIFEVWRNWCMFIVLFWKYHIVYSALFSLCYLSRSNKNLVFHPMCWHSYRACHAVLQYLAQHVSLLFVRFTCKKCKTDWRTVNRMHNKNNFISS